MRQRRTLLWKSIYRTRYRVRIWTARHGAIAAAIMLPLLIVISALGIPSLQGSLKPLFATEERLQELRSLFLTLGGALLGATAIVSSLVLFSMQVNVERMPHGLFRRLSVGARLLTSFATAFLLALIVAILSLIADADLIGVATFGAFWATLLILHLFLYSYRRALLLINPLHQLGFVVAKTQREFRAWVRGAKGAASLLTGPNLPPNGRNDPSYANRDLARVAYFQVNARWTDGAKQAIRYAVSFARRYAEQGDHEVSAAATKAIVAINAAYVEAKGQTFFAKVPLFPNPLTSDGFINDTLEHLRQTTRIGVSHGDEQLIEQTLRAFAAVVGVYATIDYGDPDASKTRSHLAAAYLTGEVERIAPHNLPDALMEGTRLVGQCADRLLAAEGPNGIRTLSQKLGVIGCLGAAKDDYRPITLTAVEQLARLSFDLLPPGVARATFD
jgi:hypothetical protein